uniref:DUF1758 domain-containing protein n=1 Tax=Haemonchus contortus TaxID=6289 RepID=A0A7I4Z4E8_HAECO
MTGPLTLKSRKSLLTRYCNNLDTLAGRYEKDTSLREAQPNAKEIIEFTIELKESIRLVTAQIDLLVDALDKIEEPLTDEQEKQAEEYVNKAHNAVENAEKLAMRLEAKRVGALVPPVSYISSDPSTQLRNVGQSEANSPKLPSIPIPVFDGKIWEFHNFWTLFEANVDSQWSSSNLQKFNYPISALRGDARELIKRYPVTAENYTLAIDLLRKKYGNTSRLITALQSRLDHAKAEQSTVQAQRALLETITPIVIQLQKLGAVLYGSYNAQKILAKFAVRIQRKVLEHIVTPEMEENSWKMVSLIESIDALISTEEQINEMVNKTEKSGTAWTKNPAVPTTRKACMFCNSLEHKAVACTRYRTVAERRNVLLKKTCVTTVDERDIG